MTRSRTAAAAAAWVVAVTASSSALAAAPSGDHLTIRALSPATAATVAPGTTFPERYTENNAGRRRSKPSRTAFYLSPSARLGSESTRLSGAARIRALAPRHRVTGTVRLTVPAQIAPGTYYLIACASDRARCRTARGRVVVAAASSPSAPGVGATGGSGGPTSSSTGPTGGGGVASTPCAPVDPPTLSATNPSCFDGDAAHGIFVSGIGDDANAGTMAFPKRTLGAGISAATVEHKDLYVTRGVYPETLTVTSGVNVYGGYDASWQRSPADITKVTGSPQASGDVAGAVALDVTAPTELQLLTLAPVSPVTAGASSYGLQGFDDGGLRLDHVTVIAAPGADGPAGPGGESGAVGGDGQSGDTGGAGGVSAVGHPGGRGGQGGQRGGNGFDGSPGQATTPDAWGNMGGPGGSAGVGSSARGAPGNDGDTGRFRGDGAGELTGSVCGISWCAGDGQPGTPGTDGHGGGGGGGGAAESCTLDCSENFGGDGGGGGGGGQGGGGGTGGGGGGGSFGILLADSAGALVRDSTVSAADGGAGGAGGGGAFGGAGGGGAFGGAPDRGGDGGTGGDGGEGGRGGDGGGGAGGPSFGIYGLTSADTPGTTVSHGHGGLGGRGGVGAGNGAGAGASGEEGNYV